MSLFRAIYYRVVGGVTRAAALRMLMRSKGMRRDDIYDILESMPAGRAMYNAPANCWYIHCRWCDGLDGEMLRSSRLVCVDKRSRKIVYDGSAHDEG